MLSLPLLPAESDETSWYRHRRVIALDNIVTSIANHGNAYIHTGSDTLGGLGTAGNSWAATNDSKPDGPGNFNSETRIKRSRAKGDSKYDKSGTTRSELAKLWSEEQSIEQRKSNIRRFGAGWLRPPGISKTYQAMLDEIAEREEQEMLARREAQLEELALAQELEAQRIELQNRAVNGEDPEDGVLDNFAEGVTGLNRAVGTLAEYYDGSERNLDDQVSEADDISYGDDDDDDDDDDDESEYIGTGDDSSQEYAGATFSNIMEPGTDDEEEGDDDDPTSLSPSPLSREKISGTTREIRRREDGDGDVNMEEGQRWMANNGGHSNAGRAHAGTEASVTAAASFSVPVTPITARVREGRESLDSRDTERAERPIARRSSRSAVQQAIARARGFARVRNRVRGAVAVIAGSGGSGTTGRRSTSSSVSPVRRTGSARRSGNDNV